jgi:hypothetical protein
VQRFQYRGRDTIAIRQNVIVPKADNPPAMALEPRGALLVIVIVEMLAAISLHDETMHNTSEVRDEWPDRALTTEFVALEPISPQHRPEPALGIGHGVAKFAGLLGWHSFSLALRAKTLTLPSGCPLSRKRARG